MNPIINYVAVVAASVIAIIIGSLWYGPVFGKPWMKLMGIKPETVDKKQKGMGKTYALMALGTFVMAYVLAHVSEYSMTYTKTYGVPGGLANGFWVWLGFVAPVHMGAQLWEKKPWSLFLINAGYHLVSLLTMGSILAIWR